MILDTRPAREYAAGHIPGVISVPVEALARCVQELTKGKEYVAYCRGPYCVYADRAVALLHADGRRARPGRARENAADRSNSLDQKLLTLPGDLEVCTGHVSGSLCGAGLNGKPRRSGQAQMGAQA